jgi:hypothetical protein
LKFQLSALPLSCFETVPQLARNIGNKETRPATGHPDLYVDLLVKGPVNHMQRDVYVCFCYKILLVYLIIVNEWIPLLGR